MTDTVDATTATTTAAARAATIEDHLDVVTPAGPATDPAGRTVFVRQAVDRVADRNDASLWLLGSDGGDARRLTAGPADGHPAWLGASGEIVFTRPDAGGAAQLWAIPADGGEARQLTTATALPLGAGAPVVSPDGARIAFSAPVSRTAKDGAEEPIATGTLRYKVDGAGLRASVRSHLFVLELASGRVERITDGDWDASEPAWSPDGTRLAFSAAIAADADTSLESRVHCVELADRRRALRVVGQARGVHAPLLWTPDGAAIVAVGAARPGVVNAELLVLHLDGELADRSLTAELDRNVMPGGLGYPGGRPTLTDEAEIVFCLRQGGSTELHAVPLAGGPVRPLLAGTQRVVSGLAVSGATARVVLATERSFGEIVEVPLAGGEPVTRTAFGRVFDEASVVFPVAEERWFEISDGARVQGFLLRDPELSGAGPLVLDVHGGPHNAWTGARSIMQPHHAELVARGYTVLMVNPRGSDGYGQAWFDGVQDAWAEADLPDLLEPIDSLIAEGVADPEQLLVTGYSYGGFMTCALTAFTDRFRVAVAGGLVADLAHLGGASDEGVWLERFEFRDGTGRSRALSPLERVAEVTAPTLILHGAADVRCPVLQAEQWHAGLRLAGVATELVLYPGGAHAFVLDGTPSHRVDYSRRLVDWFERHLSPTPAAATVERAVWQRRLDTLIAKYGVPGASLGILTTDRSGTSTTVVSSGVVSTESGVATTPDTLFQIGSISKVWTATLIQQLVDEGLLDLDAPVREVLPEFTVADAVASATVTPRQLLTHTSGIDGDIFTDTGRGDDTVERYVASLGEITQHFPPGAGWSYCNTGFVVLGRIVEVLRGAVWDEVLRERILEPLALRRTCTLPEDVARHLAAVGHDGETGDGSATPVDHVHIVRSAGPAGLISARAADVLAFAADSMSAEPVLLSRAGYDALLADQRVPAGIAAAADSMGLGWMRFVWDGVAAYGHNGGTLGQQAYLRVIPSAGVAFVLLTNGGLMGPLADELLAELASTVAEVRMTPPFAPDSPEATVDAAAAARVVGRYGDAVTSIDVQYRDGALVARREERMNPSGRAELTSSAEFSLVPTDEADVFAAGIPGVLPGWLSVRLSAPAGRRLLGFATRVYPETEDSVAVGAEVAGA